MKKITIFALAAAFSASAVQAQVLKYGAEAGETAPDTVNWYGNWQDAGGVIEFGNSDAATGSGAVYVYSPEEAGSAQDWERVLKFDGLKIKANTNYRVRLAAKADPSAILGLALMCGDENCDMPFVLPTSTGYYSQKKEVSGFNDYEYKTKSAMFHYTTDEYQQTIYPKIKADDTNPLGANRFLRISVKSTGAYYIDDIVVEEAPIAGCYYNMDVIKVDFGFSTNMAKLVKDNGGVISLDPSCAKVVAGGTEVEVEAVEIKTDGNLYIFVSDQIDDPQVLVSFNATGSGIMYSGSETPGDGIAVPSFESELAFLDESFYVESTIWEAPKLVSSEPKDNSFELDEDIKEFRLTFDKDVYLTGAKAPKATIYGGVIKGVKSLTLKDEGTEFGKTVTFLCDTKLSKGIYYLELSNVYSSKGVGIEKIIPLTIETGKISVAEIEYTLVAEVDVKGENGNHSENWTSYFNDEEIVPAGSGIRMFAFPEDGQYTQGFYLSQRDAGELGTALTYGEKADYPFELPAGDVQIDLLVSAWQSNSGNFLYELTDEAGTTVASGSGSATVHQTDQATPANAVSTVSFKIEGCKAGKYVLRLTTNTGGYGNAIIVWGFKASTYKMGQGESADSRVIVDGSFSNVGNDCTPDEGDGWTIYEIRSGEVVACEKGSTSAIGQRARFFTYSNVPNLPVAYYNRNLGGDASTSYYMTYGEVDAGEPELLLEDSRHNFTWYCVNWKGDNNEYTFQIIDLEDDNKVVYERTDVVTVQLNGDRNAAVEPYKVDFAWTPDHYGQYMLKWFMTGESSVGNIKIEQMGSLAAYWHTQLNKAVATAEAELQNSAAAQYAGTTRDALEKAINDAKTITLHTGEEYTVAITNLEQYVKNMELRRKAIDNYSTVLLNLATQVDGMTGTKYQNLDSYKQAAQYVEQYSTVAGSSIEDAVLLPLVADMQTLHTLNTNLMASNTGVAVLTDQVNKLAQTYIKIDEIVNGEESVAFFDDVVLEAMDEAVYDDQKLAAKLKKMVTCVLYKAIAGGYDFLEVEYPDEEPSEDNPYVTTPIDLSGFIRNSVFYTTTAKNQPVSQAESDGTCPGWTFNAPNGYAADWGWGGWSGNNQPIAPLNVTNSQAGTRWGCDFEIWQDVAELPVGVYSFGGYGTDRSHVTSDNVLEEGTETPSYFYVKQDGMEDVTKKFCIDNIGAYYGMTETLIDDITINPAEGGTSGKMTLGAMVIFEGGFAAVDNAEAKIYAKHPTFDYATAAAKLDKEIADDINVVETAETPVQTQYFDLNGRKTVRTKGVLIRIDTMSDGSQRASKVLVR